MSRTAVATLSTANLLHNVSVIKSRAKGSKIIAMIKANAYGHGIRSVGLKLDGHVDMLAVASIDEALALRTVGVKTDILLAQGVFQKEEFVEASNNRFGVVVHNDLHIEWLDSIVLESPIDIWIKSNTGMGRLGFSPEMAKVHYDNLSFNKKIAKSVRIMSHFACADDKNHPLNIKQIKAFEYLKNNTNTEYSFCNSAAIFNFPDQHYDYVRPGIAIYGVSPMDGIFASDLGLKPVMTVKSTLMSLQDCKAGDTIGYGARYVCKSDMRVGIVAFGYGDGYPIGAKDGTPILVNNKECLLIGRPSMDMIAVDLSNAFDAKIGDSVTLFGEGLPLEHLASFTPNIPYDIITGIQNRVKFTWI